MNEQQNRGQVAQPAQEEIKKHGDQLQKQVDAAAGGTKDGDRPAPPEDKGGAAR